MSAYIIFSIKAYQFSCSFKKTFFPNSQDSVMILDYMAEWWKSA